MWHGVVQCGVLWRSSVSCGVVLCRVSCVGALWRRIPSYALRLRHHRRVAIATVSCAALAANTNHPKFVKLIRVKYKFEEQQHLAFRV